MRSKVILALMFFRTLKHDFLAYKCQPSLRAVILSAIFTATTTVNMCRLTLIMIVGALVLSTNLQKAESFSHHRIGLHNTDSHEHLELADSKELQETSIAPSDTQSDEQVDSDEKKVVKRNVALLPSSGHSSEEEDTTATSLDSRSDERDDDISLVKLVKRNIPVESTTVDHSSEEDTTAASLLDNQSVEDDGVDSEEKRMVKRSVETTTVDHSSEEETTTVEEATRSDESDDSTEKRIVKRDIPVEVAEITVHRRFDSSEEDDQLFDSRSDEGDYSDERDDSDEGRIVKRDVLQTATDRSSEEDTTASAHSDGSSEESKTVKRDVGVETTTRDRSSEEDATSADLLDSQSAEDDHVDSDGKRRVKRSILSERGAVDRSSEESTTDSTLEHSVEDSLEDVLRPLSLDVELPSTALRI